MNASGPPSLRFRLLLDDEHAIGPGKTDLLEAIAAAGSISAAARAMGMSYKRAWQLVDELNASFALPLVAKTKGGERGGGAELTETGRAVLDAYRAIEHKALRLLSPEIRRLASLRTRS